MSAADYVCKHCGASGVKLWRRYQTLADCTKLLCANCAEKDQHEPRKTYNRGEGDQIGWYVPAVPAGEGSYWGYSSVPEDQVAWWHSLPERTAHASVDQDVIDQRDTDIHNLPY